jgi:hypothetical protein
VNKRTVSRDLAEKHGDSDQVTGGHLIHEPGLANVIGQIDLAENPHGKNQWSGDSATGISLRELRRETRAA